MNFEVDNYLHIEDKLSKALKGATVKSVVVPASGDMYGEVVITTTEDTVVRMTQDTDGHWVVQVGRMVWE